MELRKARPKELKEIIKIMIESGEWDEWKLSYLQENWEVAINNLKKVMENDELGLFYVIERKDEIVGAIPLVRIGSESLFFVCAGVKKEYEKEAMNLIEKELFEVIPSQYKILMNYARPTSNRAVPRFLEEEFGIKNNMMMLEKYDELPEFIKRSIKLSPVYLYVEKKIVEKRTPYKRLLIASSNCWKKIEKFINSEFVEAFDLKKRARIEEIYKQYNLECEVRFIGNDVSSALVINYPFGLTPSGYLNAVYFLGKDIENVIHEIESYYSTFQSRVLGFVREDLYSLLKSKGFTTIKPLQQIFYNIPENRKWRRKKFVSIEKN